MTHRFEAEVDEALRFCAIWQERLRLRDWRIEIDVVPWDSLNARWHAAELSFWHKLREAKISLLARDHFPSDTVGESYDLETNVVHELIHLKLWRWSQGREDEQMDNEEEAIVQSLAKAMVALSRGENIDGGPWASSP